MYTVGKFGACLKCKITSCLKWLVLRCCNENALLTPGMNARQPTAQHHSSRSASSSEALFFSDRFTPHGERYGFAILWLASFTLRSLSRQTSKPQDDFKRNSGVANAMLPRSRCHCCLQANQSAKLHLQKHQSILQQHLSSLDQTCLAFLVFWSSPNHKL